MTKVQAPVLDGFLFEAEFDSLVIATTWMTLDVYRFDDKIIEWVNRGKFHKVAARCIASGQFPDLTDHEIERLLMSPDGADELKAELLQRERMIAVGLEWSDIMVIWQLFAECGLTWPVYEPGLELSEVRAPAKMTAASKKKAKRKKK